MEAETNVGPVVVDELKRQAREEGYIVLAVRQEEFWLYACCVLYFLLGVTWASR